MLVDAKTSNNVSIALSRFKLPFATIKKAILRLDGAVLEVRSLRCSAHCSILRPTWHTGGAYQGAVDLCSGRGNDCDTAGV